MRQRLNLLFVIALALPALVLAQESNDYAVEGEPFVADYFTPKTSGKYGVILLTGSAGGKANEFASRLVALGQPVLSLSYFRDTGVPNALEMIPLEYFDAPKRWLMNRPETRNDGVIVVGLSKGAELALVLASDDADYKGVIALAPSSVVWAGIPEDTSTITTASSSWSRGGKPLAFVPYISRDALRAAGLTSMLHWHTAAMANDDAVPDALIEVEKIRATMLLVSGGDDGVWPAASMADFICTRSETCQHLTYEDGDHLLDNHIEDVNGEMAKFFETLNRL